MLGAELSAIESAATSPGVLVIPPAMWQVRLGNQVDAASAHARHGVAERDDQEQGEIGSLQ